jgi:DNA-binding transcriptional ArsR family regulator
MTVHDMHESTSLVEVVDTWQHTLHLPDPGALLVILSTIVANRMDVDPVWLMLIGPPSSGKTEIVEATAELPEVHTMSSVTKAGLLAGSPSKDGTGGLLKELGNRGVIIFKDLTTLLSEHASTRNEVFGIMREVHDGKVSRALGSAGGKVVKWRGHAGCIACVTDAIDSFDMAAFGERWLRYRMAQLGPDDRFLAGLSAFNNRAHQRDNRETRRRVVESFLTGLELPAEPPTLSDAEVDRLIVLTDIGTRCRSAVERSGGHHDEITLVPPPEELPRLMGALSNLSAGLSVIGVADERRWRLLVKSALDGIHSLRRRVLDVLVNTRAELMTSSVASRCDLPPSTARRHLEDLTALGVLDRTGEGPEWWAASAWLRERWWATYRMEDSDDE